MQETLALDTDVLRLSSGTSGAFEKLTSMKASSLHKRVLKDACVVHRWKVVCCMLGPAYVAMAMLVTVVCTVTVLQHFHGAFRF